MPKPLRVFFVSVAVLYALVLGWLVFETARIAAAVPPALPPFECCTPYLRGSAAVPLNAKEFDRFDLPDGSALSLRLVPSDGIAPALLFAVLTSPDAATLTVNSASLGSRSVLGSFAGHGAEVGYDGSTAALWTCFEVVPPLRDGSPLSVSVTAVNSDGSRSVFSRKGVPSHAL